MPDCTAGTYAAWGGTRSGRRRPSSASRAYGSTGVVTVPARGSGSVVTVFPLLALRGSASLRSSRSRLSSLRSLEVGHELLGVRPRHDRDQFPAVLAPV